MQLAKKLPYIIEPALAGAFLSRIWGPVFISCSLVLGGLMNFVPPAHMWWFGGLLILLAVFSSIPEGLHVIKTYFKASACLGRQTPQSISVRFFQSKGSWFAYVKHSEREPEVIYFVDASYRKVVAQLSDQDYVVDAWIGFDPLDPVVIQVPLAEKKSYVILKPSDVTASDEACARLIHNAALPQKDPEKALERLHDIIATDPTLTDTYELAAHEYMRLRDYDKAAEFLTKVINQASVRGAKAFVYELRGFCYSMMGEHEKVIADASEAIRLDEDGSSSLTMRGAAWQALGDHTQAVADFTKAVELKSDEPVFAMRAYSYHCLNQHHLAIDDLTKALERSESRVDDDSPEPARLLVMRGYSRYEVGERELALKDLDQTLELDPYCKMALELRGQLLSSMPGRYEDGQRDLKVAETLDTIEPPPMVDRNEKESGKEALGESADASANSRKPPALPSFDMMTVNRSTLLIYGGLTLAMFACIMAAFWKIFVNH